MENAHTFRPVPIGFLQAIACTGVLVFITSILPVYFKTWFVEPTGNIVMAPFFGFILAVGILLRSKLARTGAIALLVFLAIASSISLCQDPEKPGYWLVLGVSMLTIYLLIFSKNLKEYLR